MNLLDLLTSFSAAVRLPDGSSIPLPGTPGSGAFTIDKLFGLIYFVAGIVAVIMIILGAIQYTTSDGDPSKIKRAKDSILYSIVGLIAIILAAAITNFVVGNF